jgi:hypothetical protein
MIPKPTPFDAATFQKALDENIRRPDGNPYAVFSQFRDWKISIEKWYESLKSHNVQLGDHKKHLDQLDAREASHHASQNTRIAALEAAVVNPPFPG